MQASSNNGNNENENTQTLPLQQFPETSTVVSVPSEVPAVLDGVTAPTAESSLPLTEQKRLESSNVEGGGEEEDAVVLELEGNHDFCKNTPLQRAASKGHLQALWPLLQDGYSSNDLDSYGNHSLQLAAAKGNFN